MKYEELEVGMQLLCHQSNGETKEMFVKRKGIDGFGKESVVFQSATSFAQFYCRAEDVPYWYIEPKINE